MSGSRGGAARLGMRGMGGDLVACDIQVDFLLTTTKSPPILAKVNLLESEDIDIESCRRLHV